MNKNREIKTRDIQDVLELIGGRWRGAILASLCEKPKRFSELKTDLGKITPRILIKELRYLEMNKMIEIEKKTLAENSVVYTLTKHGKSIESVINTIHHWAFQHRKEVLAE